MFGSKSTAQFHQLIAPLVDRAMSLDGAGLAPWLAELRGDCPTVAREVERMLRERGTVRFATVSH